MKGNMRVIFILILFMSFFSVNGVFAQDGESTLVFTCRGKGYKDGDTIYVKPGEELTIKVKTFIKEFKVTGGMWKKNSQGQWRFYKEIKGYGLGVGVGNMSLSILKEEYEWKLKEKTPTCIGKSQDLHWKVPGGKAYELEVSTKTEGQVKTEGSASMHGIHLDYKLPGGGRKIFNGKARLYIKTVEKEGT